MEEKQYVAFHLDQEEYAIDIMKIHEVDRLKEITVTKVPRVPEFIEGIINLRGDVVPVINLRKKFNLTPKEITKETRIVIVRIHEKVIGLLVDSVSNVVTFQATDVAAPPEEIKINCEYIVGLGKKGKRLLFMLDMDKILKIRENNTIDGLEGSSVTI